MNKGMSQTLTLVVIASVLMMTALTVAVLGRSALTGSNDDLNKNKCANAVSAQCDITGGPVSPPSVCTDQSGTQLELNQFSQNDAGRYTCPSE